jgi:RNA polymerase-binding transcription factor DksA
MTAPITSRHATHHAHDALCDELLVQEALALELQSTIDELTDQADADALVERELAERARGRALETIAEVQHALHAIDDGTYGRCERCGAPIADARLEAIPFTRHCVACPPLPSLLARP